MKSCLLLVVLSLHLIGPKKIDYCKMTCYSGGEHTACYCRMKGFRKEYLNDTVEFRQKMLDKHNELRNRFATGKDPSSKGGTAANMNAIRYDLELEHIARCHAIKMEAEHDLCRDPSWGMAGQNLAWSSVDGDYLPLTRSWYDEVKDWPGKDVQSFKFDSATGHFTTMIWATLEAIGCYRVWNPNTGSPMKFSLVCNYGAKEGVNVLETPIYIKGDPCSRCPDGRTCHQNLTGLCGNIEPVPTAAVDRSSARLPRCNMGLVTALIILKILLI